MTDKDLEELDGQKDRSFSEVFARMVAKFDGLPESKKRDFWRALKARAGEDHEPNDRR